MLFLWACFFQTEMISILIALFAVQGWWTHAIVLPYTGHLDQYSQGSYAHFYAPPIRPGREYNNHVYPSLNSEQTIQNELPTLDLARVINLPYYVLVSADDYTDVYMDGKLVGQTRWWTSTFGLKVWKYPGTVISVVARDVREFSGIAVSVYKGRTLVAKTGASDVFFIAQPGSISENDLSWTKPGYNYCGWEAPTPNPRKYKFTPMQDHANATYVWSSDAKSPVAFLTFTIEDLITVNGQTVMKSTCSG